MARISSKPSKIIRPSAAPESVGEQIKHHMNAIAALFDSPKLTLIIRSRSLEGAVIVTNDEANEAINAIKRHSEQHSRQSVVPLN